MTAALLKKSQMPKILDGKHTWRLDMRLQEGREVRVETNDKELMEYFETELKAMSTFMRQVVRQYEITEHEGKKRA